MNKVATLCYLLKSFFEAPGKSGPDFNMDPAKLHPLLCSAFLFAFLWSIGGNLVESSMDAFDTFTRDLFADSHDVRVRVFTPPGSYFVCCCCANERSSLHVVVSPPPYPFITFNPVFRSG